MKRCVFASILACMAALLIVSGAIAASVNLSDVKVRLKKLGYDPGQINNTWNDTVKAAIEKYQADHKLTITREWDQRTLQSLGLLPVPEETSPRASGNHGSSLSEGETENISEEGERRARIITEYKIGITTKDQFLKDNWNTIDPFSGKLGVIGYCFRDAYKVFILGISPLPSNYKGISKEDLLDLYKPIEIDFKLNVKNKIHKEIYTMTSDVGTRLEFYRVYFENDLLKSIEHTLDQSFKTRDVCDGLSVVGFKP